MNTLSYLKVIPLPIQISFLADLMIMKIEEEELMNLEYAGPRSELPLRFAISGDKVWIRFLYWAKNDLPGQ